MTFQFPLKTAYKETQGFGENPATYAQFKYPDGRPMAGHDGLDFACDLGSGIYAVADGSVAFVTSDPNGYGNCVVQLTSLDEPNAFYYIIYGHMMQSLIHDGDELKAGQLIGLVDSTGFSTGNHLHLGVRRIERRTPVPPEVAFTIHTVEYAAVDYANGYFGYFDPTSLFATQPNDVLPVDIYYGGHQSLSRESLWSLTYNEAKVRQQASAAGFSDADFPRIKKAFVYGYWDKAFVFQTANFALWSIMTKPEFQKRQAAGTLLGSASSGSIQPH